MHKFLFYNKFIIFLYVFRALCAHHQEVIKTILYSIWYHHTCRCTGWERTPCTHLCTGRPPTGVMYQMLYNTILTSWWWAHSARNT